MHDVIKKDNKIYFMQFLNNDKIYIKALIRLLLFTYTNNNAKSTQLVHL